MHPVIAAGTYSRDSQLFADSEFEARLRRLQAAMTSRGWTGMIVYGDALQASLLTYISGFAPRIRWSMALVPRIGNEVELLLGVAQRDLKFAAELTWVPNPTTYDKLSRVLPDWLAHLSKDVQPGERRLGLAGYQNITRERFANLEELCSGWTLEDADSASTALWRIHSPAESRAIANSSRLLNAIAAAFLDYRRQGASPRTAAIKAERDAYRSGAHDVRFLLSTDRGDTFRPVQYGMPEPGGRCSAYLAVRNCGYWLDAIINDEPSRQLQERAATALQAMIRCVRPRGRREHLADALHSAAADCVFHPAPRLVSHVGIELAEVAANDAFAAGTAVSIQFGLKWPPAGADAEFVFASAVVVPSEHVPVVLFDSGKFAAGRVPNRAPPPASDLDRRPI